MQKDENIIFWVKKQLKTDKPIQYKSNSTGLVVQNKIITDTLKSYSIIPNKSLKLNIEEVIQKSNIRKDLIPSFLLGYFDGDGGIYKTLTYNKYYQYSCSITGTLETCEYFKKYFNNIGFLVKRFKNDNNNYTYQIGGRNKVKEGLSKIYLDIDKLSFFYQRKYSIYCEL